MRIRFITAAVLALAIVTSAAITGCGGGQTEEAHPNFGIAGIAQKVTAGDWELTVSNVRALNDVEDKKVAAGKVFLALDLTVSNKGTKAAALGPSDFKLKDETGPTYQPVPTKTKGWLFDLGTVKPGDPVKTVLVYEVPVGTSGLVLSFQPQGAQAQSIKIR